MAAVLCVVGALAAFWASFCSMPVTTKIATRHYRCPWGAASPVENHWAPQTGMGSVKKC